MQRLDDDEGNAEPRTNKEDHKATSDACTARKLAIKALSHLSDFDVGDGPELFWVCILAFVSCSLKLS